VINKNIIAKILQYRVLCRDSNATRKIDIFCGLETPQKNISESLTKIYKRIISVFDCVQFKRYGFTD